MVEGYGPASRLMSFPVAIIVEGAPARLPATTHTARTDARPAAADGDRATRATARPLASERALEPQSLSRRRFPLSPPFGVARGVKTDPHCVVRHLLPLLANIEGQPAIATWGRASFAATGRFFRPRTMAAMIRMPISATMLSRASLPHQPR